MGDEAAAAGTCSGGGDDAAKMEAKRHHMMVREADRERAITSRALLPFAQTINSEGSFTHREFVDQRALIKP